MLADIIINIFSALAFSLEDANLLWTTLINQKKINLTYSCVKTV